MVMYLQNQKHKFMILQNQEQNTKQNKKTLHLTKEELNYKYFYIDRKLSVNNTSEMPQTLNQLENFMDLLLSSNLLKQKEKENLHQNQSLSTAQKQKSKKEKTYKLELLNSIVIRLLDLLLNLKTFYLKNKIKKLLIRYQKQISLVHNKEEICQVLYKSLRGADQFTRIIATEIIPSYWCLFQKDLFAYHYLLEQLMINRIKIYSKHQKSSILDCIKGLLSNSKYISRLFLNDLQKLVLNISIQNKKYQNDNYKKNQKDNMSQIIQTIQAQQLQQVETFIVKSFGIKPQILFMLTQKAIFSQSQSYQVLQTLLKIISNFEYCFKKLHIQSEMVKKCYKYVKIIFLKNLPQNYKLIELFFKYNLKEKLKLRTFCIKKVMTLQYSKSQEFIIKSLLCNEYQEQLTKIIKQKFQQQEKIESSEENLLDYFYQVKKRNIYINLMNSNSQQFKNKVAQVENILRNFFQKVRISPFQAIENIQKFKNIILLTYYSQNLSYDMQICMFLKNSFKQNNIGSNKELCKLLKILLTTGNFKSAKYIIKLFQQKNIGQQSKNLLFWKLYCNCYLFQEENKSNEKSDNKNIIIQKLKSLLLLREVAKQFKLEIVDLLSAWIAIYKSLVIFYQNNPNILQKKGTIQNLRTSILDFQIKTKKSNTKHQLKQEILAIKQIYSELKTNSSYEKLSIYINNRKKYSSNFNDLMKCLYFSKETILRIYKQLK